MGFKEELAISNYILEQNGSFTFDEILKKVQEKFALILSKISELKEYLMDKISYLKDIGLIFFDGLYYQINKTYL